MMSENLKRWLIITLFSYTSASFALANSGITPMPPVGTNTSPITQPTPVQPIGSPPVVTPEAPVGSRNSAIPAPCTGVTCPGNNIRPYSNNKPG